MTGTGTLNNVGDAAAFANPRGDAWLLVQLSGAGGQTVAFEAGGDGASWTPLLAKRQFVQAADQAWLRGSPAYESQAVLTSSPPSWLVRPMGMAVRVRLAAGSGPVAVLWSAPGVPEGQVLAARLGLADAPWLPGLGERVTTYGLPQVAFG